MQIKKLWQNARAIAIECTDNGIFKAAKPYEIYINGKFYQKSDSVISVIYDLKPEQTYTIEIKTAKESASITVTTSPEIFTMNVQDFGAKGDGINDDTSFIQAAIMACPPNSRILIPKGIYKITSLFLKSDISIELAKDAVLSAFTDRKKFPVFRGIYSNTEKNKELILGTWEGDAMNMYAGIITGINVQNVVIYGKGTIDGNATTANWWHEPKKIITAARPRMIFLNHCKNISLIGITIKNSPSWNIHPYFSNHLQFINLSILSPKNSPNTDGLNPEFCKDISIIGCYFSVGDDCIAIKSGKISIGSKYKIPSNNIVIRQCCMKDGHGSITLGSEMAGGINNITAKQCLFINTDRGLRIKTRRGRGKDAIIDKIIFEDIEMYSVLTPFVINSFYFCDADGHSNYVQSKQALPVDDRTPCIKSLQFKNININDCHIAAAFFYGLPEKKIEYIKMENIKVSYSQNAQSGAPDMLDGIDENISKMGIYAKNIETLSLKNISIKGQNGSAVIAENVSHLNK